MTTAPHATDSAALPTPAPVALPADSAPQSVQLLAPEQAAKPRAAPLKRALKTALKPAADTTASSQPAVKQAAVRKTPARRATVAASSVQAVAPKLAALVRTVPAKAAPANSAKSAALKPALSKAVVPAGAGKKPAAVKAKKEKLVRDSFTIPKSEFAVLDQLKRRAGIMARSVKKSELLRAGIKLLASLPNDALLAALSQVPTIKTGRPTLKK